MGDIPCYDNELRPAFASYLPSCVSGVISIHELKEGKAVHLDPCEVSESSFVSHVRTMLTTPLSLKGKGF